MTDLTHETPDRTIGAAIRAARVAEGLTQGELATLLGVDRSTVVKFERGQRTPSVETLLQIARALRTSIAALIPGASSPAVARAAQLLARRPDLAPAALAAIEAALAREQGAPPSHAHP